MPFLLLPLPALEPGEIRLQHTGHRLAPSAAAAGTGHWPLAAGCCVLCSPLLVVVKACESVCIEFHFPLFLPLFSRSELSVPMQWATEGKHLSALRAALATSRTSFSGLGSSCSLSRRGARPLSVMLGFSGLPL